MMQNISKPIVVLALSLLVAVPLWLGFAAPALLALPADFSYEADLQSLDDLYDEKAKAFSGVTRTLTTFSYVTVDKNNGVITVKNTFNVRELTGEQIYNVERLYGIDSTTRMHVAESGDKPREGHLFAPRHLQKGESFTYWHVNYNGPAHMVFVEEEEINGLTVYRYETRYEGVHIDQTENLRSLPGVGVSRGIELEPYLQLWVEPVSGHMVKYKDDTVAYFYDLKTGERLHPWNHFSNSYTLESTLQHVEMAKRERVLIIFLEDVIPVSIVLFAVFVCLLRRRKRLWIHLPFVVSTAVILAAIGVYLSLPNDTPESYTGPVDTLRIGAQDGPLASSLWVAEHNGYFEEQRIDLSITEFTSGRGALESMLNGDPLDMVTVAQTPVAFSSFVRDDFVILAGMSRSADDVKILVRADSGIRGGGDLRGKKIGATMQSSGHYFLSLFLAQHGLGLADVTTIDMETPALADAIITGKVDAIVTWEPHIYNARMALGDNVIVFPSSGTFREDFYFVAFRTWARDHVDLLKRFMVAVNKADVFMREHPEEARRIVVERLDLDPVALDATWDDYDFGLFLDQPVLLNLEQQARWMSGMGIVDGQQPENYLRFIDSDALEFALPDAVHILH